MHLLVYLGRVIWSFKLQGWVAQELNFFCQSISTLFIVLDIYNVWHSMTAENMYMNTTRIVVISYDTYLLVVDIYVKNNFF